MLQQNVRTVTKKAQVGVIVLISDNSSHLNYPLLLKLVLVSLIFSENNA